jgi:hypothetical protein
MAVKELPETFHTDGIAAVDVSKVSANRLLKHNLAKLYEGQVNT